MTNIKQTKTEQKTKPSTVMNKRLSEILKHRLGWFMIPLLTIAFAPAYGQDGEEGEIMVLSPFSIVEDTDEGYLGRETLAGTRVKADVRDLGASITLLTDEFMDDIAANDLMEILPYAEPPVFPNLLLLHDTFFGFLGRQSAIDLTSEERVKRL